MKIEFLDDPYINWRKCDFCEGNPSFVSVLLTTNNGYEFCFCESCLEVFRKEVEDKR